MFRNKELEEQGVKQREEIKVLEKAKGRLKEQYEGMRNQARVLQGEKFKQEEAKQEAQVIPSPESMEGDAHPGAADQAGELQECGGGPEGAGGRPQRVPARAGSLRAPH